LRIKISGYHSGRGSGKKSYLGIESPAFLIRKLIYKGPPKQFVCKMRKGLFLGRFEFLLCDKPDINQASSRQEIFVNGTVFSEEIVRG